MGGLTSQGVSPSADISISNPNNNVNKFSLDVESGTKISTDTKKQVAKRNKSIYNEFTTISMQWAFSDKKASAVGAIKDVIENGTIIDRQSNWKNRSYDTVVIAGKGTLYGENSIMGIVIKTYPNHKNLNAKFYLHEIIEIKEADLYKQTAPQLSVDAEHKSTSNNSISNSNENVKKFSLDVDSVDTDYSYERLTSKPDMQITKIDDNKDYIPNKSTRKNVVNNALESALSIGSKDKFGNIFVYVNDIDTNVMVSKKGLRHSLDRRLSVMAPVTENIGKILKNSIKINELTSEFDTIEKSYVLIGIAKNDKNEPYVVSFVVNRASNEITSVDVLYAVNAKTEPAGSLSPELSSTNDVSLTGSKISISDLLDYVNKYYPDIFPKDVLKHYGYDSRPEGKIWKNALYSIDVDDYWNDSLLVQNQKLKKAVEYYKQQALTTQTDFKRKDVRKIAAKLKKEYARKSISYYIEIASGKYDYVRAEYERIYKETVEHSVLSFKRNRASKGTDIWNNVNVGKGRYGRGITDETGGKGLQNNTSGNDESVRSDSEETSEQVKFSINADGELQDGKKALLCKKINKL